MRYDRIVIGAGISGLLATRRALARGEQVLLIERKGAVGGSLAPLTLGASAGITPITVDAGAEAFSVARPQVLQLMHELGLTADIVAPRTAGAHIVYDDHLRYRIPQGIWGIPASLNNPELTGILSPGALAQAHIRDALPVQLRPYMSLAELVSERLGEEFVEKLVDPVIHGVHGSPARMIPAQAVLGAVLAALPDIGSLCATVSHLGHSQRPGSALASLRGGMHRLPQLLRDTAQQSGADIRLNTAAHTVSQADNIWHVFTPTAAFTAPHLTIATGAKFETLFEKTRAPQKRDHAPATTAVVNTRPHAHSTTSSTLVFALIASTHLNTHPLGNGALAAATSPINARATTHVNAKWQWINARLPPDHHIVRLSYGNCGERTGHDLTRTAISDIERFYGVSDVRILESHVVRWEDALATPHESTGGSLADHAVTATAPERCGPSVSGNGILGIVADHFTV